MKKSNFENFVLGKEVSVNLPVGEFTKSKIEKCSLKKEKLHGKEVACMSFEGLGVIRFLPMDDILTSLYEADKKEYEKFILNKPVKMNIDLDLNNVGIMQAHIKKINGTETLVSYDVMNLTCTVKTSDILQYVYDSNK